MLNSIRNVKFIKMRKLTMFITAVCVLFLIKLRWPKEQKSLCYCSELYIATHWKLNSRQTKLLKTTVSINFIRAGLFAIYFNALVDCVCYNEDSVKSRYCSIHFTVILARLKKIVRYTEDFVI